MRVQVFVQDRLAWQGYFSPDEGDTEALLDEILIHFSRAGRPNAAIRPPFQVGGLVTLLGGPRNLRETYRYTGRGFRREALKIASATTILNLTREQRDAGLRNVTRLPRLKEMSS